MAWKVTRPEFSAEPVGPHVQAKFVTVHIAKGKRSEFKSLFTTQLAVGLDIKKTQVQVLGMKDFESESKVPTQPILYRAAAASSSLHCGRGQRVRPPH